MTLSQFKTYFTSRLLNLYPTREIESIFSILTSQLLNYSKIDTHLHKDEEIQSSNEIKLGIVLNRLFTGEPLQYILEQTEFYGITLKVDHRALIPRSETEYMTDIAIHFLPKNTEIQIIDLCTGSGCIAIALARNLPAASISAMDLSKDSLALATENSILTNTSIHFIQDDLLIPTADYVQYDFIISNPPYVRSFEKSLMHKNILDFEPQQAIFVPDNNPLLFYYAIVNFGNLYLKNHGVILVEINENLGSETAEIFYQSGYKNVEMIKDLQDKSRFIKASKNE